MMILTNNESKFHLKEVATGGVNMESETSIKDTPTLLLFGLLFIIIFGFWLRKRVISYDFNKKSKFLFLLDNYDLIGGLLLGLGLLIIVMFL
jgi:LPXTG-motif cell wall-anchored protein